MNKPLHELFIHEIQDLYSAENQIIEALPKMIAAAKSNDLVEGFQTHLEETKGHVKRLEKIAQDLDFEIEGTTCVGMQGVLKEGAELMEMELSGETMDIALITAASKVEHYEIASYNSAIVHAESMGHENEAALLEQTLDEEVLTNDKLSEVEEQIITTEE